MKQGLRAQFQQILDLSLIDYYGNVIVCCGGNIVLEDLLDIRIPGCAYHDWCSGHQMLRLPGENCPASTMPKILIFHYNSPAFSEKKYLLGKRVQWLVRAMS